MSLWDWPRGQDKWEVELGAQEQAASKEKKRHWGASRVHKALVWMNRNIWVWSPGHTLRSWTWWHMLVILLLQRWKWNSWSLLARQPSLFGKHQASEEPQFSKSNWTVSEEWYSDWPLAFTKACAYRWKIEKKKIDLVASKTHQRKDTSTLAVVALGAVGISFSMTENPKDYRE